MRSLKKLIGAVLIGVGVLGSGIGYSDAGPAASPNSVVAEFQNQLIEVMKVAEITSARDRYKLLTPAVDAAFHLPIMVQISVGTHWKGTTTSEREDVLGAFRRMSIATLATLFSGYSGEQFEHQKNNPGPSKTILVMTELVKTDNSRVKIAYVTREFKDGWKIIDVVVDSGISELKVRRSEYRQTLRNDGISGLTKLLNEKADQLMSVTATH